MWSGKWLGADWKKTSGTVGTGFMQHFQVRTSTSAPRMVRCRRPVRKMCYDVLWTQANRQTIWLLSAARSAHEGEPCAKGLLVAAVADGVLKANLLLPFRAPAEAATGSVS